MSRPVGREYRPGNGGKSAIAVSLLIMFVVGNHLRLSLYSGGAVLVPSYLSLLAGVALMVLYSPSLTRAAIHLYVLGVWLAFAPLLNTLLVPQALSLEGYKSSLQLLASITLMLPVAIALHRIPPRRLIRTAVWIWLTLIALALVETLLLRDTFNAITEAIYSASGRGNYLSVDRDQLLYGQVRPRVLASEPSFLATTLLCLCTLAITGMQVNGTPGLMLRAGAMLVVTYMVSPSLVIMFYAGALLIWSHWPRTRKAKQLAIIIAASASIVALLLSMNATQLAAAYEVAFGERGATGSFFGRILVGPSVAMEVLTKYPLLGLGVGNDAVSRPIIDDIWASKGAFALFPWFADPGLRAGDLMSNGFWWQWIYFGLLGGIIFLVIVARIMRSVGITRPYRALVCAFVIWYSGAAFVDPLSWFLVALFSMSPRADDTWSERSFQHQRLPGY